MRLTAFYLPKSERTIIVQEYYRIELNGKKSKSSYLIKTNFPSSHSFASLEREMEDRRAMLATLAFKASATYEQVRPSYTVESVKFLLKKLGILEQERVQPLISILELGCGTGKFTRVMMEVLEGIDARVIASDPTDTMIRQFQRILPKVEVLQCYAENIDRFAFILFMSSYKKTKKTKTNKQQQQQQQQQQKHNRSMFKVSAR